MDEDLNDALLEEAEDDFYGQDGPGLFGDPDDLTSPVEDLCVSDQRGPSCSPLEYQDRIDAEVDEAEAQRAFRAVPDGKAALVPDPESLSAADAAALAAVAKRPSAQEPRPPTALYRRYRPDTFAEIIGQEHVTEPLQRALHNNKVNHAYLFSGPRGCGKTTSARILARCLNCEQGPTPTPCGVCQSCRDLATGGPGSIDVIEMDAASHGLVDDARDLRERAFFVPVASRYKIYIIDEAHMVTNQGFNALLKLVEEPPPHVKFIFATTEPEKVLVTIRSRTHHYPFRLVPPKTLSSYLTKICGEEGVTVEPGVIPLVVRAGAGSVRDSLSVLDQLLGAASSSGVGYREAARLLGYTPESLLDDIVDGFAAGDGRAVFATIDKVIEVGQDPRRFGEDLLQRLRDLVIVAQVPDAFSSGLIDVSGDQAERYAVQVGQLGTGELTRAAEVIAEGLTQMRGTTAPRLHLELMCARVLLPGADADGRGVHARLDRIERRLDIADAGSGRSQDEPTVVITRRQLAGQPGQAAPQPSASPALSQSGAQVPAEQRPAEVPAQQRPAEVPAQQRPTEQPPAPEQPPAGVPAQQRPAPQQRPGGVPTQQRPAPQGARSTTSNQPPNEEVAAANPAALNAAAPNPAATNHPATLTVADVRRLWPEVLERVSRRRKVAWILLSHNAHVIDLSEGTLVLGFANLGARESFMSNGSDDVLRDVLIDVLGADLRITAIQDGGTPVSAAVARPAEPAPQQQSGPSRRQQIAEAAPSSASSEPADDPNEVSEDDDVLDETGLSASELLVAQLGAEVINEEEG